MLSLSIFLTLSSTECIMTPPTYLESEAGMSEFAGKVIVITGGGSGIVEEA